MTERIDHVAEARRLLAAVNEVPTEAAQLLPIEVWAQEAQIHATLALVEQQRIANLIALNDTWQGETGDAFLRTLRDDLGYIIGSDLNPDIAAALGIGQAGENDD